MGAHPPILMSAASSRPAQPTTIDAFAHAPFPRSWEGWGFERPAAQAWAVSLINHPGGPSDCSPAQLLGRFLQWAGRVEEAQAERNAGGAADSSSGPGEAAVEAANEAAILAIAAGVASEAGMTARQCTPLVRALWGWCLFHDLPVEPLRQSPPAGPSTDGEAGPAAPS